MNRFSLFDGKAIALLRWSSALSILLAVTRMDLAQDAKARLREDLALAPKTVTSDVMSLVQVLGARMKAPGKEETVFNGQLINRVGQSRGVRITHQISGMVRIEDLDNKSAWSFDNERVQGVQDHAEESLLDTFVMDTSEGMIYALRSGASLHVLGHGVVPDSARSDKKAQSFDIYEVTFVDRTNENSGLRVRRYYFDSQTGLLARTRYVDRSGVAVETRFLDWGQMDGSAYPARIERFEDGQLAFAFVAGSIAGQPGHPRPISK